ncbi:MAG: UDP-N-acetylglucosamine 2-epimerase, partial [Planctomycetes bacterium]|nr:UDP-N-acetylglucosamine 2-epimerase [Planctomycetota bacterium]
PVHVVGAPGLDDLRSIPRPHARWLADEFGFARDAAIALIVQHPVGRAPRVEQRVMDNILDAVAHCGLCGLIVYPNSDAGHSGILRAIKKRRQNDRERRWVSVESIPRLKFLQCLKAAQILVGNSSAGIIEAHSAGTPAVNVGPRQAGRLRGGRAVIDCKETATAIKAAISKARRMRIRPGPPRRSSAYGNGRAGSQIAAILARPNLSDNIRPKRIRY